MKYTKYRNKMLFYQGILFIEIVLWFLLLSWIRFYFSLVKALVIFLNIFFISFISIFKYIYRVFINFNFSFS